MTLRRMLFVQKTHCLDSVQVVPVIITKVSHVWIKVGDAGHIAITSFTPSHNTCFLSERNIPVRLINGQLILYIYLYPQSSPCIHSSHCRHCFGSAVGLSFTFIVKILSVLEFLSISHRGFYQRYPVPSLQVSLHVKKQATKAHF